MFIFRQRIYSYQSDLGRKLGNDELEITGTPRLMGNMENQLIKICLEDIPKMILEKERSYIMKDLRMTEEQFLKSLVIKELDFEGSNSIEAVIEMNDQVVQKNRWLGYWVADIVVAGNKLGLLDVSYND